MCNRLKRAQPLYTFASACICMHSTNVRFFSSSVATIWRMSHRNTWQNFNGKLLLFASIFIRIHFSKLEMMWFRFYTTQSACLGDGKAKYDGPIDFPRAYKRICQAQVDKRQNKEVKSIEINVKLVVNVSSLCSAKHQFRLHQKASSFLIKYLKQLFWNANIIMFMGDRTSILVENNRAQHTTHKHTLTHTFPPKGNI